MMKTNSLDFDAQALREKILDLAMRGKLVTQDPNNEPASILLEKIKAEKAELVKEGKIKKSKALPEITDEEKPFDIPDSWEWVRLGDVLDVRDGTHDTPQYTSEGVPLVTAKNLHNGKINFANIKYISEDDAAKINERSHVNQDDVLFAMIGTIGNPVLVKTKKKFAIKNVALLKRVTSIDMDYVCKYILEAKHLLMKNASGGNQKFLSLTKINKLPFPLPPLEEQSRIAAKIAQLFALLRKVESSTQQYAKLQTLLKSKVLDLAMRGKLVKQDPNDEPASVLLEKIKAEKDQLIKEKKIKKSKPLPPISDEEKPFEIPDSWEWVRLGEITALVTKGTTPKGGKSAYVNKGINYYRAENVAFSGLSKESLNYIPLEMHEGLLKRSILKEKDILITIAGTLGRVTYVKKEDLPGNTNQAVSISRPINSDEIDEKFLTYTLTSLLQQVVKNNKTTSIPNLTLRQIEEIIFPFPPLSEQYRISTKLSQLFKFICKNKSSIS